MSAEKRWHKGLSREDREAVQIECACIKELARLRDRPKRNEGRAFSRAFVLRRMRQIIADAQHVQHILTTADKEAK